MSGITRPQALQSGAAAGAFLLSAKASAAAPTWNGPQCDTGVR